ncbi:hypothetical protein ABIE00_003809 [Arthrobacter sp. OAP107]
MLWFEECSYRGALIGHGGNLSVSGVSVLTENPVPRLDVTRPALCINDDDTAGPNEDMVQVRLRTPGPVDIVQGEPSLRGQPVQHQPDAYLPRGAFGPSFLCPLGLFQLLPELCYPLGCQPCLLGRSFACQF